MTDDLRVTDALARLEEQVDRLRGAAQRVVDFDPTTQEPAHAAWIFPRLLDTLRAALGPVEAATTHKSVEGVLMAERERIMAAVDLRFGAVDRATIRAIVEGRYE